MTLPETKHYFTTVGFSQEVGRDVYLIINKHTQVVEYETPVLPQVLTILDQFESVLGNFQTVMEEVKLEQTKTDNNVIQLRPKTH